jgi:hypothetical protein
VNELDNPGGVRSKSQEVRGRDGEEGEVGMNGDCKGRRMMFSIYLHG